MNRNIRLIAVLSGLAVKTAWAMPEAMMHEGPDPVERREPVSQKHGVSDVIEYPRAFFDRYQPQTALDIVLQLPGFQLDNGREVRGFGGASGNVLIDSRWPITKDDTPAEILSRIPAAYVATIELIRGRREGVNLRGKPVVANVLLKTKMPASIQWMLSNRYNFESGSTPSASISIVGRRGDLNYRTGFDSRLPNNGDYGPELVFDTRGKLLERRFDNSDQPGFEGWDLNAFLNTWLWCGNTFVRFNTSAGAMIRDELTITSRNPVSPDLLPSEVHVEQETRDLKFEIDLNAERLLSHNLIGRGLFLFQHVNQYPDDSARTFDSSRRLSEYKLAEAFRRHSEAIGRAELDWAIGEDHALQLHGEVAYNALRNALTQTIGPTEIDRVEVDVPGANVKVEELRGDFAVRDVWSLDRVTLGYGLAMELSSIQTSGDSKQKRHFKLVKPQVLLTYASRRAVQTQMRLAREVSQLDLNDFVTATVFLDDDLALGNPRLKPESTWLAEVIQEFRFGEIGIFRLKAFHHWVNDVEDLIPVTPAFEAPGNIGNGRRWGAEMETTVPLTILGLANARADVRVHWQDSVVADPVTGENRRFTPIGGKIPEVEFENDTDYAYIAGFRQDFGQQGISWGFQIADQGNRPQFKVNELEILDVGMRFDAFIETTRWWNVKLRLDMLNILDFELTRDRQMFAGQRGLSPIASREIRSWRRSPRLQLTISGTL